MEATAKNTSVENYLEKMDRCDAAVKATAVVLGLAMENPETQDAARQYFEKWVGDCTSEDGIGQIIGSGAEETELAPLIYLATNRQSLARESKAVKPRAALSQNRIIGFFSRLSDREKLIVLAYDSITCHSAFGYCNSGKLDRQLSDIVENYDASKIPADMQWLIGVKELVEALQ